jgi:hypothetical protein
MATTRTAEVELYEGWCIVVRIHAGAIQSLADAHENLATAMAVSGTVRRPLLVDITVGSPLEPAVRHFYSGEKLAASFLALGLLVEATPFGRVMGNMYLRIARTGIPMRLFADEAEASAWLRTFVR